MSTQITYGLGGYNPAHPNGNKVEEVVDNGDGTGVRTVYNADGTVASTENLTGLPIPQDDPEPTADAALLTAAEDARRAAFDAYMVGKTNSVANVIGATRAGSDAYLAALQG